MLIALFRYFLYNRKKSFTYITMFDMRQIKHWLRLRIDAFRKKQECLGRTYQSCYGYHNLHTQCRSRKQVIEEAVKMLNTLQSNAQTIEKMRKERDKRSHLNIPNMIKYAQRTGITLDDIDNLNVIHVSGTKGKGSTCAFCESILRHHGYKTGFFSSPHLVEVRERFRINGQPISRSKFADYFWEVYSKLISSKDTEDSGGMPAYFAFLTVMAFNIFMQEKVDVAIIEVGIGGQYDSTNLIRKPVVCGVTSLGLDHVSILGDTVEKIAWHKAGIFKPDVPAFSSPQPEGAMAVLQDRANQIGNSLDVVLPLSEREPDGCKLRLGICGHVQHHNAALAVQLCKTFMKNKRKSREGEEPATDQTKNGDFCLDSDMKSLNASTKKGLELCRWPGRTQTLRRPGLTYFLDGAHTVESIQQCVEWFQEASERDSREHKGRVAKVVVFNSTGDRDPSSLIEPLMKCEFDAAVFCPNLAFATSTSADTTNLTVSKESQINRVLLNKHAWEKLIEKRKKCASNAGCDTKDNITTINHSDAHIHIKTNDVNHQLPEEEVMNGPRPKIPRTDQTRYHLSGEGEQGGTVYNADDSQIICDKHASAVTREFSNIYTALQWATQGRELALDTEIDLEEEIPKHLRDVDHIQVLVTGSLHLVGGILGVVGTAND